jgi:hypothetical protein
MAFFGEKQLPLLEMTLIGENQIHKGRKHFNWRERFLTGRNMFSWGEIFYYGENIFK